MKLIGQLVALLFVSAIVCATINTIAKITRKDVAERVTTSVIRNGDVVTFTGAINTGLEMYWTIIKPDGSFERRHMTGATAVQYAIDHPNHRVVLPP